MVRSRTFLDLRNFPNVALDARKVLARNLTNREAQSLLADIKAVGDHIKSVDRKLSKITKSLMYDRTSIKTCTLMSDGRRSMPKAMKNFQTFSTLYAH